MTSPKNDPKIDTKRKPNDEADRAFDRATNTKDEGERDHLIIDDGVGSPSHAPLTRSGDTGEASRKSR